MPVISFTKKNRPSIEVKAGANLMNALLTAEVPVASSCHGDGVCCKCKVQISQGRSHLSLPNETEIFLKEKYQLKADQRISCQAVVLDNIEIDTGYW